MDKINWEQRRYEIAKGVLSNQVIACIMDKSGYDAEALVRQTIELADELIKQLQNNEENEEK